MLILQNYKCYKSEKVLCYVRQISGTQDLRFLSRCWRRYPCSGIWLPREKHIRAFCCICPRSSRRNV